MGLTIVARNLPTVSEVIGRHLHRVQPLASASALADPHVQTETNYTAVEDKGTRRYKKRLLKHDSSDGSDDDIISIDGHAAELARGASARVDIPVAAALLGGSDAGGRGPRAAELKPEVLVIVLGALIDDRDGRLATTLLVADLPRHLHACEYIAGAHSPPRAP